MNLYYITVCIGVNNKLLVLVLVLVLGGTGKYDFRSLNTITMMSTYTRAVLRLVWPFDGIVPRHIHKRLI